MALVLGTLQERRLLIGRQAREEAVQVLGHVEDHIAAMSAPLRQRVGQGGTIEVGPAERSDEKGLEAVALAAPRLAPLGEPPAQVVRSEERRVGKEGGRPGNSRWAPYY